MVDKGAAHGALRAWWFVRRPHVHGVKGVLRATGPGADASANVPSTRLCGRFCASSVIRWVRRAATAMDSAVSFRRRQPRRTHHMSHTAEPVLTLDQVRIHVSWSPEMRQVAQ